MRVTQRQLQRIILEEMQAFDEACGDHSPEGGLEVISGPVYQDALESQMMSKGEALKAVSAIAQNTSCPVTRAALEDVVSSLSSHEQQQGHAYVPDLGQLDPQDAFGIGHGIGSGEVTDYDVTGENRKRKPG
jgi:hypothetical protein